MPHLSDGQQLLGLALTGLPCPPGHDDLFELLDRFSTIPNLTLWSVSQELEERRRSGQLRHLPRYAELHAMVMAAYGMCIDLDVLLAERWIRRAQANDAAREQ
jgi:hypothetical protein